MRAKNLGILFLIALLATPGGAAESSEESSEPTWVIVIHRVEANETIPIYQVQAEFGNLDEVIAPFFDTQAVIVMTPMGPASPSSPSSCRLVGTIGYDEPPYIWVVIHEECIGPFPGVPIPTVFEGVMDDVEGRWWR